MLSDVRCSDDSGGPVYLTTFVFVCWQNCKHFQNRLNHCREIATRTRRKMKKNEQVNAICCRPEIAGDDLSCDGIETIEGYAALNFEIASFSSFQDIQTKSFRDGGCGGGHGR